MCHRKLRIATKTLPIPPPFSTRPASNGNFQGELHSRSAIAPCVAPAPGEVAAAKARAELHEKVGPCALVFHSLVGGFHPSEKYARQIGSFPQFSG